MIGGTQPACSTALGAADATRWQVVTQPSAEPASSEGDAPPPAASQADASAPDASEPLLNDLEAQEHLDRGLERFYAQDFEAASREFRAAYALEPASFVLYAWAQAERYAGNCPRAEVLYGRFLASDPPAHEAEKARERIIECGGVPPPLPSEVEQRPTPTVPEPGPEPAPPPPPWPSPPHRVAIALGGAGLILGGALGAGGGVVVADGRRRERAALMAPSQQGFVDQLDQARTRQGAGVALLSVGGAVVVAGAVVLGVFVARALKERRASTARGAGRRGGWARSAPAAIAVRPW